MSKRSERMNEEMRDERRESRHRWLLRAVILRLKRGSGHSMSNQSKEIDELWFLVECDGLVESEV